MKRFWILVLVWATATAILVVNAWPTFAGVVDDAFISARYAAHFAEGHGLVYNVGEQAVEGYTNLAWTVLLGIGLLFGIPAHQLMTWMGLVFGSLAIAAGMALTDELVEGMTWWPALTGALIGASPHLAVVSTIGLEMSMYVAAVLFGLWAMLAAKGHWRWGAGLALVLVGLVRPEGVLVAGLAVGYDLLVHRKELKKLDTWILAIVVTGGYATLLGWRMAYYGAPMPNTFDAKSAVPFVKQTEANLRYLRPDQAVWWPALVLLLASPIFPGRRVRRLLLVATAVALVAVASQVNLWMPGTRLLVPSLMLTICAIVAAGASLPRWWSALVALPLILGATILPFSQVTTYLRNYNGRHTIIPGNGTQLAAEHLLAHAPPDSWLATRDAGVFAYYVSTSIKLAELHNRTLTQPLPEGRDADVFKYTPVTPEFIALTHSRAKTPGFKYGNDRRVWTRATNNDAYDYLGRVYQHYHRYYDVYARSDLNVPPLPSDVAVNFAGPKPAKQSNQ
ncbi:MAG: hypothetical protein HN348_26790 [Proteobacteria bacterium]|nr:hypothetical protein [Pseudomonadota bacterium]